MAGKWIACTACHRVIGFDDGLTIPKEVICTENGYFCLRDFLELEVAGIDPMEVLQVVKDHVGAR